MSEKVLLEIYKEQGRLGIVGLLVILLVLVRRTGPWPIYEVIESLVRNKHD